MIDVDATPEDLFAIVTDLEAFPDWLSDVKEVEVLERDEDGYIIASRMTVDVTIKVVSYVLDYEFEYPDKVTWTSRPGGDIKQIDGSYEFAENADGSTLITYNLEIDPGFPVPGFLLKRAAKHITKQALDGLKARAEAG